MFSLGICSEETEIKKILMENYDTTVIPKISNIDPLNLELGIAIRAFESIDQIDGTILSNIWLRYFWNDYRLRWNSSEWNISKVVFSSEPDRDNIIWTPDLYLYNTAENPLENLKYSHLVAYSNGDVTWSRPGMLKSTCKFNLRNYPFDVQNCYLKFGSWVYNGADLNLLIHQSSVDTGNMQKNEEWLLSNTSANRNIKIYGCCPEPYYDITFEFQLTRHSLHYTSNIIIPIIATSSLMIMSLIVPWDSGERISFVTTVMLSIIVFLLLLSENLPKTDSNPFLSRLTLGLTVFSLISVFFTVIISSLYSHRKNNGIMSRLLKLIGVEKKPLCYNSTSSFESIRSNYTNHSTHNPRNIYNNSSGSDTCTIDNGNILESTHKLPEITIDNNASLNTKLGINVDDIIEKNKEPVGDEIICNKFQINKRFIKDIENINNENKKNEIEEYDCKTTAGYIEAIFTLVFFVSFIVYLIYMFTTTH